MAKTGRSQGFSLIELCICMGLISIIVSVTSSPLSNFVEKSELHAISSNLRASLMLARQHAISTTTIVHICPIDPITPEQCKKSNNYNSNWSAGWLVFADKNNNNELDSTDQILSVKRNTYKTKVVFNQRGRLRFFNNGSARSAGFYLCNKTASHTRHIKLLYSGRARSIEIMTDKQKSICQSA